ncbi:LysR substrate-binding domain-containing protein, partial [Kitasatospora indigofera]|uniref:LysR substrate-binding domain-containing protein n=1 Tax=Kitasatospora indigofera TaxID=67307 RepID=UPI003646C3D2
RAPRAASAGAPAPPPAPRAAPRAAPPHDNVEEMLEQVADGAAICFAPASMARYYGRPDLRWVPLTDAEPLRVVLAWVAGADNPLVRGFAEVVRELAARA